MELTINSISNASFTGSMAHHSQNRYIGQPDSCSIMLDSQATSQNHFKLDSPMHLVYAGSTVPLTYKLYKLHLAVDAFIVLSE